MARLIVSRRAQIDSNMILLRLARNAGRTVAAKYAADFASIFDRLLQFPESGAPRQALGPDVHIAALSPYIVIYEYDSTPSPTITILRIVQGRRRIAGDLLT